MIAWCCFDNDQGYVCCLTRTTFGFVRPSKAVFCSTFCNRESARNHRRHDRIKGLLVASVKVVQNYFFYLEELSRVPVLILQELKTFLCDVSAMVVTPSHAIGGHLVNSFLFLHVVCLPISLLFAQSVFGPNA